MKAADQNISPLIDEYFANRTRVRLNILKIGFVVLFVVICVRLAQIQVVESPKYRDMALKQYAAKVALPASRGSLFDRNGNILASNSKYVSFAADPKVAADDARLIARTFSQVFGKPRQYYMEKLQEDSRFVWLERQVHVDYLQKIKPERLQGIVVREEPRRLYHYPNVAGQLIGTTDVDNNGIAGAEFEFNKDVRGIDGYVVFQRDGLGRARPVVDYPRVEPEHGHNIYLTIDVGLQSIIEEELKRSVEQNKADGAICVMLQPKTGEVLAIGQYPSVNPSNFGQSTLNDQKLRAVTDMFEPGSVFKLVTASAALEFGLIRPDQKFFAENGLYKVPIGGGKFHPIKDTHPYGWITFQEAMAYSSNIVMAKASDIVGSERLYKMARDYGFGIATNLELPGEVKGSLKKPMEWSGTTLNTMAYGYEVGVTPIQIAAAYAAVANDGVLMKPYILKKEVDATGTIVRESQPQTIRRVTSPRTVQLLKEFFTDVVEYGTAKPTRIDGVKIAGKTGTSKKLVEGRYESNYTASFVGFYPVENPRVVCLVMMDNPRGSSYTGGTTSAPVFRAIAQRFMNTSEMFAPATLTASNNNKPIPESEIGEQKDIQQQSVTKKSMLSPKSAAVSVQAMVVPDVKGFSMRSAVGVLTMSRFQPVVKGSGIVVNQQPVAGIVGQAGMKVMLICQPKSSPSVTTNSSIRE